MRQTQEFLKIKNLFEKVIIWVKQYAEVCCKDDTSKFRDDFEQLSVKVPPQINL
jgi:hypothetical protein